ncbi:lysophospholipid acyltransferase family protein [Pontibacter sp. HSC-14F20]|uniref:lysophospholipid acyltransferase family protein n=1 Tax=Pontibacter sp. HSC-14F20 TaxID=2864136 RepID=UPI001C736D8C|nr:lysophospholipid acyltransferase family protein [Pontibacter sp. HSC-14F20]MBX0333984.1 lysophospholipid acyltransferase family protein [Pontibacter sp. HSC-14F20]
MLYLVLKLILRTGLWVFFRRFVVRNRHLMPARGPLLVVANHPNTFMDPIVIASLLPQQVYFIAKSTVFSSPLHNWLLHHMNLIPINRREDQPNEPVDNEATFKASYQALEAQKTLLIFPEGTSFNERRLRKLKTGTARMALSAVELLAEVADLQILPVGLNYSDPTRFRSDVFVNVGKPIAVASYLSRYRHDGKSTVNELTDHIRQQLEKLIVITPSDDEDILIRQIEDVYKGRLAAETPIAAPRHVRDFLLTRAIAKGLAYFLETQPVRVEHFQNKIRAYTRQLQELDLQHLPTVEENNVLLRQTLARTVLLTLTMPLYLYGLINNYLAYIIPSKVADVLTQEQEFRAPIMLSVGIFSFPLLYTLQAYTLWHFCPNALYLLLYLISLPLSGFLALRYWNTLLRVREHWLLLRLFMSNSPVAESLKRQQQELIEKLESARKEYLHQQNDSQSTG